MMRRHKRMHLFCDTHNVPMSVTESISFECGEFTYSHCLTCPVCGWQIWGTSLTQSIEPVIRSGLKLGARRYVINDIHRIKR
jgi:hypothetical protein